METKLVTAVKAAGGVCWKFTFPGTAGVPDRIVLLPPGRIALWRSKHLVKSSVRYNGFASEHFGGWASKPLCWTTRSRLEDTFGGSGSTLMACEQMNRICYMMELDENTPPSFSGAMWKTPGMPKACMSFVADSRFLIPIWSKRSKRRKADEVLLSDFNIQSPRPNSINSKSTLHCGHFINPLDKISSLRIMV